MRCLARRDARARRAVGGLAGAFLRRHAHHELGFARLGDYTRERLALSARELQSMAQVAAALAHLPRIDAAFERGEVSWTQVRMLVTVATAETEDRWLAHARGGTVRTLERRLRETVQARAIEPDTAQGAQAVQAVLGDCAEEGMIIDDEPATRIRLRCPRGLRSEWRRAVELARRVAGEPLPLWQAAEAIAAEGISGLAPLNADPRSSDRAGGDPSPQVIPGTSADHRADHASQQPAPSFDRAAPSRPFRIGEAVPRTPTRVASADPRRCMIDRSALEESLRSDPAHLWREPDRLDAFALDGRLRALLQAMQRTDAQTGGLLRLVVDLRLFLDLGFSSLAHYVRECLGISARKSRALVALERRCMREPALAAAYRSGDLSWLRALTIAPVLGRHAPAWIARAGEVTLRRLADEVAWALEVQDSAPSDAGVAPPRSGAALLVPERQMRAHVGADQPMDAQANDAVEVHFLAPVSVAALFWDALSAFGVAHEPQWRGFARLLAHVIAEWERQPRHRDPVFARDGWRCAVPACSARKQLHDHHIRFRSRGGTNARDNRVTVCAWHHLRGIHAGSVRAWGLAPLAIRWDIGVRPGHAPLLRLFGERYLGRANAGAFAASTDPDPARAAVREEAAMC